MSALAVVVDHNDPGLEVLRALVEVDRRQLLTTEGRALILLAGREECEPDLGQLLGFSASARSASKVLGALRAKGLVFSMPARGDLTPGHHTSKYLSFKFLTPAGQEAAFDAVDAIRSLAPPTWTGPSMRATARRAARSMATAFQAGALHRIRALRPCVHEVDLGIRLTDRRAKRRCGTRALAVSTRWCQQAALDPGMVFAYLITILTGRHRMDIMDRLLVRLVDGPIRYNKGFADVASRAWFRRAVQEGEREGLIARVRQGNGWSEVVLGSTGEERLRHLSRNAAMLACRARPGGLRELRGFVYPARSERLGLEIASVDQMVGLHAYGVRPQLVTGDLKAMIQGVLELA